MLEHKKIVKITEDCFQNMTRAVIESWDKEPIGYLYGIEKNGGYLLFNSYALLTAQRKEDNVKCFDFEAIKRLRKHDRATCRNSSLEKALIGGFHSHPGKLSVNSLSEYDLESIMEEMKWEKMTSWIEILLKLEQKRYRKPAEIGEWIRHNKTKIKSITRSTKKSGYIITLSAYKIDLDMSIQELKLKLLRQKY